ncbi:MAG: undecaprenyldiphospho-muramoylpentapeptide beta-N-acetylglucosaminyltransferase [Lactobacillus sp.]|nr:undecaprenyldiphospho-muramoylpentapeptide beta-N-acetylglucosaminyltransferase [Lactobacillus sp.]
MRIIFTGGGTGGHIYPILAIIERLKERNLVTDDQVLFVGTAKGLESRIVPNAGVPFKTLTIQGFNRKNPLKNFKTIKMFMDATKEAKAIIEDFKPDLVFGTGGYASGAMVYQAAKMKIPTMIHESNSVVGLTNKFLGHFVDRICYSFDDARKHFPEKSKLVKTGNPRSQQVLSDMGEAVDISEWGLNPNAETVLVFGGSRGALAINRVMLESIKELEQKPYQVIWATGTFYYDKIQEKLENHELAKNIVILPYIKNMPGLLPQMTTVVARSGATSIAEFTALGVPAILIPSPNVTHNHQYKNAVDLEDKGAAIVLPEHDLNPNCLLSSIDHLLLDQKVAHEMAEASRNLGITDSSDQIIDQMLELIQSHL